MLTWENTGVSWVGTRFKSRVWYLVCRFIHSKMYPDHPDYNDGDY